MNRHTAHVFSTSYNNQLARYSVMDKFNVVGVSVDVTVVSYCQDENVTFTESNRSLTAIAILNLMEHDLML